MSAGAKWQMPDNFSAVISLEATYMERIMKEAIEIQLHDENCKREAGFILSYMAASNQFTETLSTTRNRSQTKGNDLLTPPTNQRDRIPSCAQPNKDMHRAD